MQVQASAHPGVAAAVGGGEVGPGAAAAAVVEAVTDTEAVAEITTAFKVAETEAIIAALAAMLAEAAAAAAAATPTTGTATVSIWQSRL